MRSEMIRRISSASLHTGSKTRGCAFKNFQRKAKAFTTLRAPRPPKSCRSYHAGRQPSRIPAPSALVPLAQAPAGEFLKTCHWHVFLTEFHLIGSNPLQPILQQKNRPKAVSLPNRWLGQQDSNLHNWYQKPGSCHWTMAQCARLGFWDYNVFTGFASPANMHASLPGSAPESGNAHSTFFG